MATFDLHPVREVDYPSSDGQPMAETDFQRKPLTYAVDALAVHFRNRDDIYVSGNLFIYYEEGNPKAAVAPDVFVVIGAAKHDRASYRLWQEPKTPDFVMEITSKRTRSEDQGSKRGLYAFLGVEEYWQYDPTGDYLDPPLKGLRLVEENYQPIAAMVGAAGRRVLHSDALGLDVYLDENRLRFLNPATGQLLLTLQESEQARQEAEARAQTAEARVAELESRLRARQDPSSSE